MRTPRTKADFIERNRQLAEAVAWIQANAPARCISGEIDHHGECHRCAAAAGEVCRMRRA